MKPYFFILLLFTALQALAQPTIGGKVSNTQGESLPGANVFLEGTFTGATSAANGNFSFVAPAAGTFWLVVRYLGYREFKQQLQLGATDSLWVQVQLKEEPAQLGEVVITAGTFEASDVNRAASLSTQDVLTTASALGDVIGAIQTLPGVSQVSEDGRLFVRGGSAGESRMYINGMAVENPYGASVENLPARGRFSPTMFQGFRFSSGAYGAEWGGALSAVLGMDHRNYRNTPKQTDFSLMTVGGSIGHEQSLPQGGVAAQLEYTNLAPYMALIPQRYTFHKTPENLGGSLVLLQQVGTGTLQLMLDSRYGGLHLTQPDLSQSSSELELEMNNQNHYGQLRWLLPLNPSWVLTHGLALSADKTELQPNGARLKQQSQLLHFKSKLEGDLSRSLRLNSGIEVERPQGEETYQQAGCSLEMHHSQQWWRSAAWAEADWQLSRKLALRAGGRFSSNSRSQEFALLPRFSFAWQLQKDQQLSLASGIYTQDADAEFLRQAPQLAEARSQHLVLNYQYQPKGRMLRAELYYKNYEKLPLYTTAGVNTLLKAQGKGYARGLEIFWRDRQSFKATDYWISYSFVDSRRQWSHYPEAVTPPFAVKHSLGLVYKYFIADLRSQLGGSFTISSGRPYENPNTEGFMNERAPVQQNLSLNWAWLWKQNLIFYTAVTNVLGGGDAYTYRYANTPNESGFYAEQPVGASAKRFFFLGLFYTLSHDKTKNQLENL